MNKNMLNGYIDACEMSKETEEDIKYPGRKSKICMSQELLEERKTNAERLKQEVEAWMGTIPIRMQRIIQYKYFEGRTWEQTAAKISLKASGESIRKEFERFMKNN